MRMPESKPVSQTRLFVAIALPDAVRRQLRPLQRGLSGVRWAREEQLHLTLRFIGEVEADTQTVLEGALEDIHSSRFHMTLNGVGCFPGPERPRVLWAGVVPCPTLLKLEDSVSSCLEPLGIPREQRPYHPHLTLGRCQSLSGTRASRWIRSHQALELRDIPINAFALFSSRLTPQGAIHRREREFFLG